jgi:glutamate-1-semialdehyde aminotransferase
MRFNSIASVERTLKAHGSELAAVIVEPICGSAGMIPAEPEFMRALRLETERRGILLICDEVIALRLGIGGGQGEYGIAQVTGAGSLFQVHFTKAVISDYRSAKTANADAVFLLFLGMMNRGVQLASRGMGCLSTPMQQRHVDRLVEAFDATLRDLRREGWIQ